MSELSRHDSIRAVHWCNDHLLLLDQRQLPFSEAYIECHGVNDVRQAIADLAVRGAPAIGIAAAWGVVLAAIEMAKIDERIDAGRLEGVFSQLNAARPTAVNLRWALSRMRAALQRNPTLDELVREAASIQAEDLAANQAMGVLGAGLLGNDCGVLTHCNTGSLATAGYGTALGVIRSGYAGGKIKHVYATETRPWQQGARLTMWELMRDAIPATLIADSAAAHLMKLGLISWVIVGADRIAANGDTANKIGTYQLAIAARYHKVRFMVVAPSSTVDMNTPAGAQIEIELRDPAELLHVAGKRTVAEGLQAWNPVFDVTPAELIDAVVTERGVIEYPDNARMAKLFG